MHPGDTLRDQFRLAAEEGDDVYACARLYFKRAKLEKFINDIDGEEDDNSAVKKHTGAAIEEGDRWAAALCRAGPRRPASARVHASRRAASSLC